MISALKAEFIKLFTVRSTYIILGLSLALEVLFAFYISGWRAKPDNLADSGFLSEQVTSAVGTLNLLVGIVGVLLVTHEYRYNTIMYTLTSNKSRSRVLFAKLLAISCFAIVFALVFGGLSPLLAGFGIHAHGLHLVHQYVPVWSLIWRTVVAGWGFVALATILALLIRIQVGAIAAMFLIPGTVEQLLGLLLRKNQVYLPFSSLGVLLGNAAEGSHISYVRAALVGVAYITVGWLVAWIAFIRRDAN